MTYPQETRPRSSKQAALLCKLTLSSEFTADEAEATRRYLNSPACTVENASILIERALTRINGRDNRRTASTDRKALYHAAKQSRAAQAEVAASQALDKQQPRIDNAFGSDSIVAKLAREEGLVPSEQAITRRERSTQRQFAAANRRHAKDQAAEIH